MKGRSSEALRRRGHPFWQKMAVDQPVPVPTTHQQEVEDIASSRPPEHTHGATDAWPPIRRQWTESTCQQSTIVPKWSSSHPSCDGLPSQAGAGGDHLEVVQSRLSASGSRNRGHGAVGLPPLICCTPDDVRRSPSHRLHCSSVLPWRQFLLSLQRSCRFQL